MTIQLAVLFLLNGFWQLLHACCNALSALAAMMEAFDEYCRRAVRVGRGCYG